MTAATYDIVIEQGSTYEQVFYLRDEVLDANGQHQTPPVYVVKDLTNYNVRMKIKGTKGGGTYSSLSTTTGEITVVAAQGKITLTIPALTTAGFAWTQGVYDMEIYDNSTPAKVTRVLKGGVTNDLEVTD